MDKITIIPTATGYKPDEVDERDKVFGSTPRPIIKPDGDWRFIPLEVEYQAERGFETFGCVTFTTLSAREKLAKVLFGEDWNKSERFTYIASETNPADRGNSPRKVADSVRNHGVVDEKDLPFNDSVDTFAKFNSPIPLPQFLKDKAQLARLKYDFSYDFLPTIGGIVTREAMRDALKRGQVGIAVHAWAKDGDVYVRNGSDTHLTLLEYVKDNGELCVFDSYPPASKTLRKDFMIEYAIVFYLDKKNPQEQFKNIQLNFISILLQYVAKLFQRTIKVGGEIITEYFRPRY